MPRDRAERVALTEAGFRIANERMSQWEERQAGGDAPASYFCECGIDDCREEIRLTQAEYESVRSAPRHFFVLPEHIIEDLETEVERHDGYLVIEKPPALEGLLSDTDPRQDGGGPALDEASQLADEIRREDG
jgi:hypothetical protein